MDRIRRQASDRQDWGSGRSTDHDRQEAAAEALERARGYASLAARSGSPDIVWESTVTEPDEASGTSADVRYVLVLVTVEGAGTRTRGGRFEPAEAMASVELEALLLVKQIDGVTESVELLDHSEDGPIDPAVVEEIRSEVEAHYGSGGRSVSARRIVQAAYRYYTVNRPPGYAAVPSGHVAMESWYRPEASRQDVPGVGPSWGWVEYAEPLSAQDVASFQLVPAPSGEDAGRVQALQELQQALIETFGGPDIAVGQLLEDRDFSYIADLAPYIEDKISEYELDPVDAEKIRSATQKVLGPSVKESIMRQPVSRTQNHKTARRIVQAATPEVERRIGRGNLDTLRSPETGRLTERSVPEQQGWKGAVVRAIRQAPVEDAPARKTAAIERAFDHYVLARRDEAGEWLAREVPSYLRARLGSDAVMSALRHDELRDVLKDRYWNELIGVVHQANCNPQQDVGELPALLLQEIAFDLERAEQKRDLTVGEESSKGIVSKEIERREIEPVEMEKDAVLDTSPYYGPDMDTPRGHSLSTCERCFEAEGTKRHDMADDTYGSPYICDDCYPIVKGASRVATAGQYSDSDSEYLGPGPSSMDDPVEYDLVEWYPYAVAAAGMLYGQGAYNVQRTEQEGVWKVMQTPDRVQGYLQINQDGTVDRTEWSEAEGQHWVEGIGADEVAAVKQRAARFAGMKRDSKARVALSLGYDAVHLLPDFSGVEKLASGPAAELPVDLFSGTDTAGQYEHSLAAHHVRHAMEGRARLEGRPDRLIDAAIGPIKQVFRRLKGYTVTDRQLSRIVRDRIAEDGRTILGALHWDIHLADHTKRRKCAIRIVQPVVNDQPSDSVRLVTAAGQDVPFSQVSLDRLLGVRRDAFRQSRQRVPIERSMIPE